MSRREVIFRFLVCFQMILNSKPFRKERKVGRDESIA